MDQITLKNFRCFREQQTARLAPLTLLVGENSTGKTSFMAMIRALWDIAYRHRVPDFKEDPYDLGSFDEIVHRGKSGEGYLETFEAGFDVTFEVKKRPTVISHKFDVVFAKKGTAPMPAKRRLSSSDGSVWIEHGLQQDDEWRLSFGTPRGSWKLKKAVEFAIRSGDHDRILPFFLFMNWLDIPRKGDSGEDRFVAISGLENPSAGDWKSITKMYRFAPERRFFDEPLYASAPVRSKPHRTYDPSRPSRDPEGDYIPMYLANVYFQDKERWKAMKNTIEKFGEESGLFNEISVKPFGKMASGPFQIQVRKFGRRAKGPQRNLIDVGYGVSQVLPVITELLRVDAPPIFLLQQPEVHLHPSAQAALGTLLCQVAEPDRQLVVETHSDHLLERVRMDVRDGKANLDPEDVSVLFFERGDLDVEIHSLRLDQDGNVLGAPPGYRQFFMDETKRSLNL